MLAAEKELTKLRSGDGREEPLPRAVLTKRCEFDAPRGKVSMLDLIDRRDQPIFPLEYDFRKADELHSRNIKNIKEPQDGS